MRNSRGWRDEDRPSTFSRQAGGWQHGLHIHIENPPLHRAWCLKRVDESGPSGLPALSPSAHYGERNGDAHARPGDAVLSLD